MNKQQSLIFPDRRIHLHAMVVSAGIERRELPSYDWCGLKRGNAPLTLFQYTLDGMGKMRYENREYELEKGSAMILHFPHDNRYWLPKGWPPWEFIFICLNGSEVLRIWKEVEKLRGPKVYVSPTSQLISLAYTINEKLQKGKIASAFESSSLAYQFCMAMLEELLIEHKNQPRRTEVKKAIDFCQKHYNQKIGIADMALAAGCSRYHFSRIFRNNEGVSPWEYLIQFRLQKAAQSLRNTSLSVKQISHSCGFSDPNYFCKIFRKRLGLSPTTFRKSGI